MRTNLHPPRSLDGIVAAFGLPGSPRDAGQLLDEHAWADLVARIRRERMEGLLIAAVEAGKLPSAEHRIAEARALGRARARVDLELERETLRAAGSLEIEAVPYRILKGPALSHTVYPDPMWRGFGDVDILVGPENWNHAVAALEAAGARRLLPEIRPEFDVRYGKDATLVSAAGWEIDLHRRIVLGPYGFWAAPEELLHNEPGMLPIGGRNLPILDADEAFLMACYSVALADDPPRLAALRDVAQIAFAEAIDVDRVADTACRWRGLAVVARALALSGHGLGVRITETTIGRRFRSVKPRASDKALMAAYRGPGRGYTSQLVSVVALTGARDKLAYLGALARPQDEYLRARGFTRSGFITHAGRRIVSHR